MDKGIRPECNRMFAQLLPTRVNTREGNTAFRKAVMAHIMENFGITVASAATHYNHSFIQAKANAPELVEGLGRPEDKKGGRKPKVVLVPELCGPVQPAAVFEDAEGVVQTEFTVRRKSDDSVVAEKLSFEAARELVGKAAAAKKAKLYWV
jgi:hypothetical protein